MQDRTKAFRIFRRWERLFLGPALLACIAGAWPLISAAQSTSDSDDPRVEKLYSEAKEAQARGDHAGAITKYESILKVAPRLGAAYNNLGMLYFQQHDYRQAIVVLEKGLAVDPKMASAAALLGIAFYETGDYGKARARLEVALRSNPKDNNAELFLANDLIKLGDLQAAARHLEELARREPNDQEVFIFLAKSTCNSPRRL